MVRNPTLDALNAGRYALHTLGPTNPLDPALAKHVYDPRT